MKTQNEHIALYEIGVSHWLSSLRAGDEWVCAFDKGYLSFPEIVFAQVTRRTAKTVFIRERLRNGTFAPQERRVRVKDGAVEFGIYSSARFQRGGFISPPATKEAYKYALRGAIIEEINTIDKRSLSDAQIHNVLQVMVPEKAKLLIDSISKIFE